MVKTSGIYRVANLLSREVVKTSDIYRVANLIPREVVKTSGIYRVANLLPREVGGGACLVAPQRGHKDGLAGVLHDDQGGRLRPGAAQEVNGSSTARVVNGSSAARQGLSAGPAARGKTRLGMEEREKERLAEEGARGRGMDALGRERAGSQRECTVGTWVGATVGRGGWDSHVCVRWGTP